MSARFLDNSRRLDRTFQCLLIRLHSYVPIRLFVYLTARSWGRSRSNSPQTIRQAPKAAPNGEHGAQTQGSRSVGIKSYCMSNVIMLKSVRWREIRLSNANDDAVQR
jgi:hypothetical protein